MNRGAITEYKSDKGFLLKLAIFSGIRRPDVGEMENPEMGESDENKRSKKNVIYSLLDFASAHLSLTRCLVEKYERNI